MGAPRLPDGARPALTAAFHVERRCGRGVAAGEAVTPACARPEGAVGRRPRARRGVPRGTCPGCGPVGVQASATRAQGGVGRGAAGRDLPPRLVPGRPGRSAFGAHAGLSARRGGLGAWSGSSGYADGGRSPFARCVAPPHPGGRSARRWRRSPRRGWISPRGGSLFVQGVARSASRRAEAAAKAAASREAGPVGSLPEVGPRSWGAPPVPRPGRHGA